MSIEGTVVGASPGPPDDPQGLQQEIERTREHLGETVEALVAKVDVKARAQGEATRLMGRLKASAVQARLPAGKVLPPAVQVSSVRISTRPSINSSTLAFKGMASRCAPLAVST